MSFLDRIRPVKVAEARDLKLRFAACPPARPAHLPVRDFKTALTGDGRVIAEVKRRSPSHPSFVQHAAPGQLALAYARGGAAALSIVTDKANFGTSLEDVAELKQAVDLPVIAKDFIVDAVQIQAAWAAGADAVLLIARMLEGAELAHLLQVARSHDLAALVECHDEVDLGKAAEAGADIVGVNNRDLASLTTDLAHGERLLPHVHEGALRVAESGMYRRGDIDRLAAAGADAFLIGHALLQSRDPGDTVAALAGVVAEDAVRVKICGLTRAEDAVAAHRAGANLLGVIFAESPRRVTVERAAALRAAAPDARLVGVFRDQGAAFIADAARRAGLDLVQLHGAETPGFCRDVAQHTGLPVIKALAPEAVNDDTAARYDAAAYFLVDPPKGGSDDPAHAAAARDGVLAAAARLRAAGGRVFLAGGLEPGDAAGLRDAGAFGLDVSRGVESAPGVKDHDKMLTFLREAGR
jgi:indole-3-glycerol phosphate synthase/phosphoribosylanthranilate isomerase